MTTLIACWAMLLLAGPASAAYQETLGADANLNGGAAIGSLANSGGDGKRATPYLYEFTTGGLDLGAFKLVTTSDSEDPKGTSYTLDLGGFDLSGVSGNVSLATEASTTWEGAGSIAILNVGTVSIGAIETFTTKGRSYPGEVTIGSAGDPATGDIRVDRILAYSSATSSAYGGSLVDIYGSGDVLIQTSGGVAGDIVNYSNSLSSKDITVSHDGTFVANNLDSHWYYPSGFGNYNSAGAVTLNGDANSDGADGTLTVHNIDTHLEAGPSQKWFEHGGDVTISGYLSVSINAIDAHHLSLDSVNSSARGGNVSITDIAGNIEIAAGINLDIQSTNGSTKDGALTLESGMQILLGELDMAKVDSASLDGVLSSMIDKLLNFDTSAGSGSGSTSDPFIATQTALRTPAGEIIYYDAAASENAYLGGATYQIADLAGTGGVGGWLTPATAVPEPTTLALLSLGGVLGLTGMARRRRK